MPTIYWIIVNGLRVKLQCKNNFPVVTNEYTTRFAQEYPIMAILTSFLASEPALGTRTTYDRQRIDLVQLLRVRDLIIHDLNYFP